MHTILNPDTLSRTLLELPTSVLDELEQLNQQGIAMGFDGCDDPTSKRRYLARIYAVSLLLTSPKAPTDILCDFGLLPQAEHLNKRFRLLYPPITNRLCRLYPELLTDAQYGDVMNQLHSFCQALDLQPHLIAVTQETDLEAEMCAMFTNMIVYSYGATPAPDDSNPLATVPDDYEEALQWAYDVKINTILFYKRTRLVFEKHGFDGWAEYQKGQLDLVNEKDLKGPTSEDIKQRNLAAKAKLDESIKEGMADPAHFTFAPDLRVIVPPTQNHVLDALYAKRGGI